MNGNGKAQEPDVAGIGANKPSLPYDSSDLTSLVIAATGKSANPRLAEMIPSLVHHLHAFAKEVSLTTEEWMAGIQFVSMQPDLGLNSKKAES